MSESYPQIPFGQGEPNLMPIERLIRSTAFDPKTIEVMLMAQERARKVLRLADRDDCAAWIVATKIVEQVWRGEREPDRMCRQVLKEFGPAGTSPFLQVGPSTNPVHPPDVK